MKANEVFNAIEDLPFPTVTAINGIALGGGFEMCLATDYRVMAPKAKVGLPEVKLGIFPGFGGTVRLSRLVGVDNAVEWIAGGTENRADRSEEHTSELQSRPHLVCRLLLEKKKKRHYTT